MSKPREKWWGYVKNCIRDYPRMCDKLEEARRQNRDPDGTQGAAENPKRPTEREALNRLSVEVFQGRKKIEFDGVRLAVENTLRLPDGEDRIALLKLIFWSANKKTLAGAAMACHVSERTARRWHSDFIRLTAFYMNLSD